jgi:hypothetical protein
LRVLRARCLTAHRKLTAHLAVREHRFAGRAIGVLASRRLALLGVEQEPELQ